MKRWQLFILSALVILFVSLKFDSVKAGSVVQPIEEKVLKLEQIKEKRAHIKELLDENRKIEKQVEEKSIQIDKLLVGIAQNSLIPTQAIEEKLNSRLESIMTELMQIGEVETASWKHLNTANKQIEDEKYDEGINNLDKTISNLLAKHEMLVSFNESSKEFIRFLNSLQYK